MNQSITDTQKFRTVDKADKTDARSVLADVHTALIEKGYNPVNQIVGYIMSGDPTYITGYKNARSRIGKLERHELLEEIVTFYLENARF
ncbi:MAG: IreB family regulatory phosphoprotein [Clostridiales bacterium]|jgi:uncharacterized protein (UPF0297 family)|nr:IreB family regulatory phosphoprotein [Clostridiales bacterium]